MAVLELIRQTESFPSEVGDPVNISRSEYMTGEVNWLLLASGGEPLLYPGDFGISA